MALPRAARSTALLEACPTRARRPAAHLALAVSTGREIRVRPLLDPRVVRTGSRPAVAGFVRLIVCRAAAMVLMSLVVVCPVGVGRVPVVRLPRGPAMFLSP